MAKATTVVVPSKNKCTHLTVNEMEKLREVPFEEVRDFSRQHNKQIANQIFPRKDSKKFQEKLIATDTLSEKKMSD